MTDEHYIEWIALCTADQNHIAFLKPHQEPSVDFLIQGEPLFLYEYCNLHGLWQNDLKGVDHGKHDVKPAEEVAAAPQAEETEVTADFDKTKYLCTACQYIYDPVVGDVDGGIEPGTSFADLPEDWVCPVCGVSKDMFEVYEG